MAEAEEALAMQNILDLIELIKSQTLNKSSVSAALEDRLYKQKAGTVHANSRKNITRPSVNHAQSIERKQLNKPLHLKSNPMLSREGNDAAAERVI